MQDGTTPGSHDEGAALKLVNFIIERATCGQPGFDSAEVIARKYLDDKRFTSNEERIDALIGWEMSKNGGTGFLSGVGGMMTLPLAIPAAMLTSWVIQARMISAIALICGHKLNDEGVRTLVLLSLTGNVAARALKDAGIKAISVAILSALPFQLLLNINKSIGYRLLSRAGVRGLALLARAIPVLGGVVSGTVDLALCRQVGMVAKHNFLVLK
ncbi:MAG: hypothetical protein ACAI35_02190 [Candidatus Methylacidiphilales bacterium]|nr:hypothetical protein [Candidatus Methylacidiphilales bacterium]